MRFLILAVLAAKAVDACTCRGEGGCMVVDDYPPLACRTVYTASTMVPACRHTAGNECTLNTARNGCAVSDRPEACFYEPAVDLDTPVSLNTSTKSGCERVATDGYAYASTWCPGPTSGPTCGDADGTGDRFPCPRGSVFKNGAKDVPCSGGICDNSTCCTSDCGECSDCLVNNDDECLSRYRDVDTTIQEGCDDVVRIYSDVTQSLFCPGEPSVLPPWLAPLLIGLVVAILTIAVVVKFANNEPESEPTFWDKVKCTFADLTNCDKDKFQLFGGRRDESATMTVKTDNAEAYHIAQVLSTTSASTVTSLVVSQLQAANYTGPMPTMITTAITSVTDGSSSSDGSDSNTTLVAVAIVVAAVLVLLAVLVVGALVYMFKMNKKEQASTAGQAATPPTMGAVGLAMNPMHSTVDSKEGLENI